MNVKRFHISQTGPYMDSKNWLAWCRLDNGIAVRCRGRTAMQALHGLFLELGESNDEAGNIPEVDGQKSLPAGDGGRLPDCD